MIESIAFGIAVIVLAAIGTVVVLVSLAFCVVEAIAKLFSRNEYTTYVYKIKK